MDDDEEPGPTLARADDERSAGALLKLALQGERDIVDGRTLSLADHRARTRALLREAK